VRGRRVGRGASIGGGAGDNLPLVLAFDGGRDFAWGVVAGGIERALCFCLGGGHGGEVGGVERQLAERVGQRWGCMVGGVVVGGLTRGSS